MATDSKPTINDVARVANVSKKTVSRVINKSKLLSDKTRERVEQVIAKVRALADERGASAAVVEQVYRAMIAAFIDEELRTHAALNAGTNGDA